MNAQGFIAILPLIVLAGASLLVLTAIAIHRNHALSFGIALAGLAAAFISLWPSAEVIPRAVTPLFSFDSYALFFIGLIVAAAFITVILCYGYLERQNMQRDEMYVLLLIATLGAAVLAASSQFVSFFLGLELLSVPLYAMIAYLRRGGESVEAGIKYLILAAASAAFLLFGIALAYSETGSLAFASLRAVLANEGPRGLLIPAMVLIVTGVGFKLAVVPFHMWTPDVYQGAPAPVAAFIATVSKGAMVALLMRFAYVSGVETTRPFHVLFAVIAIASMIGGNLLALMQTNVKRLLAYSSIAHLGYILVALQVRGAAGASAVAFYLVAYFVTTLGAFGVVGLLSSSDHDAEDMEEYRGLFWRRPVLACVFATMLFSLAGMPLTAGFLAKFYVVTTGASAAMWAQIITLALTSGIGIFYYLRVILAVFGTRMESQIAAPPALSGTASVVLGVLTAALVWLGVYPGPLLNLIDAVVRL